jgi:hypothetical protein
MKRFVFYSILIILMFICGLFSDDPKIQKLSMVPMYWIFICIGIGILAAIDNWLNPENGG